MTSRAKMENLQRVLAKLKRVPVRIVADLERQLDVEADDLVEAMKANAPVDPASDNPGQVRDNIRAYRNPDRPLSRRIIADAKDPDGQPISTHVEAGHRAVDGSHVPASPFFFPTYRARKRGIQRRLKAVARKAIKAEFPT